MYISCAPLKHPRFWRPFSFLHKSAEEQFIIRNGLVAAHTNSVIALTTGIAQSLEDEDPSFEQAWATTTISPTETIHYTETGSPPVRLQIYSLGQPISCQLRQLKLSVNLWSTAGWPMQISIQVNLLVSPLRCYKAILWIQSLPHFHSKIYRMRGWLGQVSDVWPFPWDRRSASTTLVVAFVANSSGQLQASRLSSNGMSQILSHSVSHFRNFNATERFRSSRTVSMNACRKSCAANSLSSWWPRVVSC